MHFQHPLQLIKLSQKHTVWTARTPWPLFRLPWPQGWGYEVESLTAQSVDGKVSLSKISSLCVKRSGHFYLTYTSTHKHALREPPLFYRYKRHILNDSHLTGDQATLKTLVGCGSVVKWSVESDGDDPNGETDQTATSLPSVARPDNRHLSEDRWTLWMELCKMARRVVTIIRKVIVIFISGIKTLGY